MIPIWGDWPARRWRAATDAVLPARTQAALTANDQESDALINKLFDRLRKQWSMNLEIQLSQQ